MGKLNALKIKAITEPGRYSDGNGLVLITTASGAGSWFLRIQVDGKRRDIGLGSLKAVSLASARRASQDVRTKMAEGIDVVAERRRELLVVPCFREAAAAVHEEHKLGWKNGKHKKQWLATLEAYRVRHCSLNHCLQKLRRIL